MTAHTTHHHRAGHYFLHTHTGLQLPGLSCHLLFPAPSLEFDPWHPPWIQNKQADQAQGRQPHLSSRGGSSWSQGTVLAVTGLGAARLQGPEALVPARWRKWPL